MRVYLNTVLKFLRKTEGVNYEVIKGNYHSACFIGTANCLVLVAKEAELVYFDAKDGLFGNKVISYHVDKYGKEKSSCINKHIYMLLCEHQYSEDAKGIYTEVFDMNKLSLNGVSKKVAKVTKIALKAMQQLEDSKKW